MSATIINLKKKSCMFCFLQSEKPTVLLVYCFKGVKDGLKTKNCQDLSYQK